MRPVLKINKKLKCFLSNTEMASCSSTELKRTAYKQYQHNFNLKMPVTTRSASNKMSLVTAVAAQPKFNTIQGNMQLRSGKVLPGCIEPVVYDPKVRVPTYKLSAVEQAKFQVRQKVKARQREIAERHTEKAVDKAMKVLNSYVVAFNEIDHYVGVDPVMEKIRLVGMMFAYANSLSIHTMMHPRLGKVRSTMLNVCAKFSNDAKEQIDIRIKAAMEIMPDRNPKRYYTAQLDDMQGQLDKFTHTYANRL